MPRPRLKTVAATTALVGLLLLLLPGCIVVDGPLSDPLLSKADADACGVWQNTSDSDDCLFIGLEKVEEGAPPGLMRVVKPSYNEGTKGVSNESYFFTTTEINGGKYANVLAAVNFANLATKAGYAKLQSQGGKGALIKYELKDKTLTIWNGDQKACTAAKDAKQFTDGAGFAALIKSKGDKAFFPDDKKTFYKRLR